MSRPNTTDTELRYIIRMPDKLWRVWITFNGKDFGQMYFSDKEYGNKDASLTAAIAYRDKVITTNKIPLRIYAGNGFCVRHKNNKSGVVGILLAVDNHDDPRRVHWQAKIMVDGNQRKTSQSVRQYGYVGAWQLVAAIRENHTQIPVPKKPPAPPAWLRLWAAERGVSMPKPLK